VRGSKIRLRGLSEIATNPPRMFLFGPMPTTQPLTQYASEIGAKPREGESFALKRRYRNKSEDHCTCKGTE
jgi:hypothetical protein